MQATFRWRCELRPASGTYVASRKECFGARLAPRRKKRRKELRRSRRQRHRRACRSFMVGRLLACREGASERDWATSASHDCNSNPEELRRRAR